MCTPEELTPGAIWGWIEGPRNHDLSLLLRWISCGGQSPPVLPITEPLPTRHECQNPQPTTLLYPQATGNLGLGAFHWKGEGGTRW
jgi:hypothetical protein